MISEQQQIAPEDSVVGILADLVAFQTVSKTSNLEMVDYIETHLKKYGATCKRVPCDDGSRTNVYATIGPMVEGGIILSGHTDVVPVEGQAWSSDPFVLSERAGKLYGRGTCDMKGFLAAALAIAPLLAETKLKKPVHFAFSYDEELGCIGAPRMIAQMARELPRPAGVLVGEPTEMNVASLHKGCMDLTTKITGYSVHSSRCPEGVSAIAVAAKLINWLGERQEAGKANADQNGLMDPPFSTFHVGVIHGGTASNIVAQECSFTTDIRVIASESTQEHLSAYKAYIADTILPQMKAISEEADVEVIVDADIPPLRQTEDNPMEQLMRRLTGDNMLRAMPGTTEGGQFQDVDFPTIVCGPGSGQQAHKPDEFVEKAQLIRCVEILRKLIAILA